jgi:hypothetical protein
MLQAVYENEGNVKDMVLLADFDLQNKPRQWGCGSDHTACQDHNSDL